MRLQTDGSLGSCRHPHLPPSVRASQRASRVVVGFPGPSALAGWHLQSPTNTSRPRSWPQRTAIARSRISPRYSGPGLASSSRKSISAMRLGTSSKSRHTSPYGSTALSSGRRGLGARSCGRRTDLPSIKRGAGRAASDLVPATDRIRWRATAEAPDLGQPLQVVPTSDDRKAMGRKPSSGGIRLERFGYHHIRFHVSAAQRLFGGPDVASCEPRQRRPGPPAVGTFDQLTR